MSIPAIPDRRGLQSIIEGTVAFLTRVADKFLDAVELGPSFALRHCSYAIGRASHQANVHGFNVHLRRRSADAVMFRQIFRKGDWDFRRFPQASRVWSAYSAICRSGERPLIIDAGANIGAASLWLAEQFPEAHVIAVEPDPTNARMCRLNTKDVPRIQVHEGAIGAHSGRVALANPVGSADAVRTARTEEGAVPVFTVQELCENGQLFLIKIDIEGFESDLFSENTDWLDSVSMVMFEPHDWMLPGRFSSRAFQQAMSRHAFEVLIKGENLFFIR
jgi:FkbM family methyltransferase